MTSTTSRDLGHGVRVMPGNSGGIVVQSSDYDLGWRTRIGGRPGAAGMWEEACYEVVEREPWRRGGRWILAPWTGEDVMRVVLPLDAAAVKASAERARLAARAEEMRPALQLLSPVLGFATGSVGGMTGGIRRFSAPGFRQSSSWLWVAPASWS